METQTGPGAAELRAASARLGDRSNDLAALGRAAEIPALWEQAIAEAADDTSRAHVTAAYAWYQVLHGEVPAGIALAAGPWTPAWTPAPNRAPVTPPLGNPWR